MRTDDFGTDPDVHLAVVKFQDSLSPRVAVGHRVAVAEIGDVRFPRDLPVFLPSEEVGPDGMEILEVILVQPLERDLIRRPVGRCVDPVEPLQAAGAAGSCHQAN